jgi:hypothetical protein
MDTRITFALESYPQNSYTPIDDIAGAYPNDITYSTLSRY